MQNKIVLILIVIAIILSLAGIYLARSLPKEVTENLKSLQGIARRLDREVQLLTERVAPYIYTGEAVGYVIEFEDESKFYFAGPTGLSSDLKLIGDYYQPDVAFLPIGNIYTLDPKTAAFAASLVNPTIYTVPSRYASFPELTETPSQFLEELEKYDLRSQPLTFEAGEEQKVIGTKVEWLGHGHWLFESPEGVRILVDPEVRYNPSFPKKYQQLTQLERVDLVLITQGHFDSVSLSDLRKWGQIFDPVFIAPYELGIWLKAKLPAYKIIAVNQGGRISKEELLKLGAGEEKANRLAGITINVVSARHSSSATPESLPTP